MQLEFTSWATIAALAVYIWTAFNVSKARSTYQVKAPASDGPPEFLRVMRVQINTLEQIVLLLPALWLCAVWNNDKLAAIGGVAWVIGRMMYALGYYQDAGKRNIGFSIGFVASISLLVGAIVGMVR
jgi:glutathione S-transferase